MLQCQIQQPALVLTLERRLDQRPVLQHPDLDLDDLGPQPFERSSRGAHALRHFRERVVVEVVRHHADTKPAHSLVDPSGILSMLHLDRRRVARVMPGDGVHCQRHVFDAPRDGAERHVPRTGRRQLSEPADQTVRRFQPNHSAIRRRVPDGCASICADGHERLPGSNRSRRSAARPTGDVFRVPWIVRRPEHAVGAAARERPFVHIVLADDDRSGIPETLYHCGVVIRDVLGQDGRAAGRDPTRHRDVVLHPDRDAMQRPSPVSLCEFGVSGFRAGECLLSLHHGKRVQPTVRRRYLFQCGADQFDRRNRPPAQLLRDDGDGFEEQLVHGISRLSEMYDICRGSRPSRGNTASRSLVACERRT